MKRKIYLELIITLVIGFAIGFFTNSLITDNKIKGYTLHKGESQFWQKSLSEVGVTPEQRKTIAPIIRNYSTEAQETLTESWKKMLPIWQKMEDEIMLQLTPEQQEKLKLIQNQRKKDFKNRINHPPHRNTYQKNGEGYKQGNGQGNKKNNEIRQGHGMRQDDEMKQGNGTRQENNRGERGQNPPDEQKN